jgi:hypothetical protein
MDLVAVFISSLFGSAGLFGLVQFLISRHDGKNKDLAHIKKQLSVIDNKCSRNELATARLQLFFLMETQPDNEDAIEATAQRYFIELDGNAEAWAPFHKWAVKHDVDTGWYKALLKREKGSK